MNATDTLLLVDEFPPYAGKVPFTREMVSAGGQVATAMVTCARLGMRARYIGTIGDDERGRFQRDSLDGTGVDTSGLIVRAGCPNQTAYIVIDGRTGERTVLWQRAECLRVRPDEIRAADITNARLLHIDGCDVEAAACAASIARANGVPVSLDVDTVYPNFTSVLRQVDYLIASSGWAARWTGESDPIAALERVRGEYGMRVAAMTLGDRGALAMDEAGFWYSPAFQVPCADTTGAGDAFHGGFCYAVLNGLDTAAALEFSNATAALNCTAIGARGHIAVLSEVQSLVAASRRGEVSRLGDSELAAKLDARALSPASHAGLKTQ